MGCCEKMRNKVLVKKEQQNNLIGVVFSGHSVFRSDQWRRRGARLKTWWYHPSITYGAIKQISLTKPSFYWTLPKSIGVRWQHQKYLAPPLGATHYTGKEWGEYMYVVTDWWPTSDTIIFLVVDYCHTLRCFDLKQDTFAQWGNAWGNT
jgi:hypothetical protein